MDKKQKMLIVDDSEMDREILSEFFNDKYDIIQADNGFDALITAVLEKDNLAMIILDVMMPLFNGFETLQKIRSNPQLSSVPVILITAEGSMENVRQGFQSGMTDFIVKPFDARNIRQRVEDAITKFNTALNRKNSVGNSFDGVDYTNLADMVESMFEFRMIETPRHIKSVQSYTGALMKYITRKYVEYGIPPEDVPMIQIAAAFHDIGKLALPDAIINKPESQLSESERHIMQEHTLRGCLFVKCLQNDTNAKLVGYCCDICMYHHERSTGQGYPRGYREADIPIVAQAVGLAVAYDALSRDGAKRTTFTHERAVNAIKMGKRGAFSTKILSAFENVQSEFYTISNEIR